MTTKPSRWRASRLGCGEDDMVGTMVESVPIDGACVVKVVEDARNIRSETAGYANMK
jgi:hypothetical protein